MCLLPVRASVVKSIVQNKKVLKTANKVCHKVMGAGIKETYELYKGLYTFPNDRTTRILKKIFKEICG